VSSGGSSSGFSRIRRPSSGSGLRRLDGAEAKNRTLSEDRARAVAGFLGAQGNQLIAHRHAGYGTESPAAANATVQGRSRNRRVEVTVQ